MCGNDAPRLPHFQSAVIVPRSVRNVKKYDKGSQLFADAKKQMKAIFQ